MTASENIVRQNRFLPWIFSDAVISLLSLFRIRKYRATKPLFAMDFQNDAEYVGGCVAGGRRYLHINANGDVDPCVFIHYAGSPSIADDDGLP